MASLSASTVTWRIEEMGENVQLKDKAKDYECFALAMDESNDVQDTAVVLCPARHCSQVHFS